MKKTEKDELRKFSIEGLQDRLKKLELQLVISYSRTGKTAISERNAPTTLTRDIKRNIARIKTIINEKRQLRDSMELCKDKPYSKRRERRLKGKLKEVGEL